MRISILLGMWLLCVGGVAQPYFSRLYDINSDAETGIWASQNGDKTAILVGALCNNNTTACVEILRLDEEGDLVWGLLLDTMDVVAGNNLITTDEYIYFAGPKTGTGRFGLKILQFDWDANFIRSIDFSEQFPHSSINGLSLVDSSVVLTFNKRGGDLHLGIIPDTSYYCFFDLDLNYERHYKHTSGIYRFEVAHSLKKAKDGSGYYSERYGALASFFDTEYLDILKLDSLGNIIWTWAAEPSGVDAIVNMTPTLDGGVVTVWHKEDWETVEPIYPEPSKIIKLSSDGEQEWEHTFNAIYPKNINYIFLAANGDIIGVGEQDMYQSPLGHYDALAGWIFRMTAEGELLWERNIFDLRLWANNNRIGMRLFAGAETPEGDFILTGSGYSLFPNGIPVELNPDTWVVRTNSEGCVNPNCGPLELITSTQEIQAAAPHTVKIWPLPTSDNIWVSDDGGHAHWQYYSITSLDGKPLSQGSIDAMPVEISLAAQPAGLYFLTLVASDGNTLTRKINKQ